MGDGSASSQVLRPRELVHLMFADESWPSIPKKLLNLTPKALEKRIERKHKALNMFSDAGRTTEDIYEDIVFLDIALTAVRRQRIYDQGVAEGERFFNVGDFETYYKQEMIKKEGIKSQSRERM